MDVDKNHGLNSDIIQDISHIDNNFIYNNLENTSFKDNTA